MVKLSSIDEINKILRAEIIKQSELQGERVVNGYTVHGQDLVTKINKYCVDSYKPEDSYVVFELRPKPSYITETDYNEELSIYSAYEFHLFVYGFNSTTLVNKLVARMLTQNCRLNLQNQGIYLQNIENIQDGTDFINDTLFPRTDLDINIYCQMKVNPVSDTGDFESLSEKLHIIEEEDNNG